MWLRVCACDVCVLCVWVYFIVCVCVCVRACVLQQEPPDLRTADNYPGQYILRPRIPLSSNDRWLKAKSVCVCACVCLCVSV